MRKQMIMAECGLSATSQYENLCCFMIINKFVGNI